MLGDHLPDAAARRRPLRVRMAASTVSAAAGETNADQPSLARHLQGIEAEEPARRSTSSETGIAASSSATPTPAVVAISHTLAASPPRVGSRSA